RNNFPREARQADRTPHFCRPRPRRLDCVHCRRLRRVGGGVVIFHRPRLGRPSFVILLLVVVVCICGGPDGGTQVRLPADWRHTRGPVREPGAASPYGARRRVRGVPRQSRAVVQDRDVCVPLRLPRGFFLGYMPL
ncbi:hypothetical protein HK405_002648, partial [Cladochytrium tenue]